MINHSGHESKVDQSSVQSAYRQDSSAEDHNRRAFLRFLSIGAGSAIIGGAFGQGKTAMAAAFDTANEEGITRASALVDDQAFWDSVKESFIRPTSEVVFNVDSGVVAPRVTLNTLSRGLVKASPEGSGLIKERFTSLQGQREIIGNMMGAHADDTALVNGATSGIMHALTGLNWREGDVIFYTDHEHPNIISVIKSLRDFYKIIPVEIPIPASPYITAVEIARVVEQAVSRRRPEKRRLCALVWSSPTYQTGVMLPISRLADIARRFDLVSICDAAHLMGMAAIDFARMDVDFLGTCGHKWQCGPSLTGALLRGHRMTGIWSPGGISKANGATLAEISFGARLSMTGAKSSDKFDALIESSLLWEKIGRSKIEAYSLALGAYLKSRIEHVWGAKSIRSPLVDPELFSAITSFDPFYDSKISDQPQIYKLFADQLREINGLVVRVVKLPPEKNNRLAIRVSTPLWVNHHDIDRLIDAMRALTHTLKSRPFPLEGNHKALST